MCAEGDGSWPEGPVGVTDPGEEASASIQAPGSAATHSLEAGTMEALKFQGGGVLEWGAAGGIPPYPKVCFVGQRKAQKGSRRE